MPGPTDQNRLGHVSHWATLPLSSPPPALERHGRVVRGHGDADLGVGRRHTALGAGHVRPSLQELGGKPDGDVGRRPRQRRRREAEG